MFRFSSIFRWKSPITLLSLALLLSLTACTPSSKIRGTSKAGQSPEGEVWTGENSQNGQGTGTVRRNKRNNRQPVQPGMTYDAVIAQLGQPIEWSGYYSWTTLSGKYGVVFNNKNEAIDYKFKSTNAPSESNAIDSREAWEQARSQYEKDQNTTKEIAQLVQNRASFNSISAHLGGTPFLESGDGVWRHGNAQYRLFFVNGAVHDAQPVTSNS